MRLLILLLMTGFGGSAAAQTLPTGEWRGELRWSNAQPVPLSAEIETCAEGLKLRLASEDGWYRTADTIIAQGGPVEFTIRNTARRYTLACSLDRQADGTLAGACARGSSRALLTLVPPETSVIGCSE